MLPSEESGPTATCWKQSFAFFFFFLRERKKEEHGGKSMGDEISETSGAKGISR